MQLKVSKVSTAGALVVIAVCIASYLWVPAVQQAVNAIISILTIRDVTEAIQTFRNYLLSFGAWAPLVSGVLMVFQSVVAPLPAFVLTFTNGLLFGWAWGALLSWSSAMVGALVCFWIARALGRPVVERLVGGSKSLEVSDLFFTKYGDRTILITRLLPFVSFDVISYGAGLTPIKLRNFLIATGLGQLPATLAYSYLGQNLTGSIQVLFWVFTITLAIFVLGWIVGPGFLRRLRAKDSEATVENAT
jgi:uncharacterized membrane protein YdjX (TVP38/TMEM64 family)